jgi:hypothetical protein
VFVPISQSVTKTSVTAKETSTSSTSTVVPSTTATVAAVAVTTAAAAPKKTTKPVKPKAKNSFEFDFDSLILSRVVGEGNYGVVWLAYLNDKAVACKQLKSTNGESRPAAAVVKEFVDEARVLARIPPSPFVVRFIGLCRSPLCMLTEYVDGGSLWNYLGRPISLSVGVLMNFIKQIAQGLQHLHQSGVIHR